MIEYISSFKRVVIKRFAWEVCFDVIFNAIGPKEVILNFKLGLGRFNTTQKNPHKSREQKPGRGKTHILNGH